MNLFNLFKKQKKEALTKELISLSSLANVVNIDYFKDNNEVLELINLRKKEYLETLIKEKVLTSKDLKENELHNKLNMIHTLIEQNTLDDELFEKVIFVEEDKVKALIKLRKFAIYNEQIKDLEEEVISRIIALKEILKKTFLNRQKKISIINEINNLTNIFVILMNQKETLKLCLNNYSLKCFDITKEKDQEKEKELLNARKEKLMVYEKLAFGKVKQIIVTLNDMAQAEIALEEYVYNYKADVEILRKKVAFFCKRTEKDLKNQKVIFDKILNEITNIEKYYKIFYEFGKRLIIKEDLKELYKIKFTILTYSENCKLVEPFVNMITPKLELETYEEIIYDLINAINSNKENGLSSIQMEFKNYTFTVLRLLKKELQTNGKYDALEILKDKYKLNLLLAFSYPIEVSVIKEIYKHIYVKKSDYPEVNFYERQFVWNYALPLETVNELKLMQNQKQDLGLYLFLKKYYHTYDYHSFTYYLPEGLNKICYLTNRYSDGTIEDPKQMYKILNYVDAIRKNARGKEVVLPKTLVSILGDVFGDTEIPKLKLNEGLAYFNFNYLPGANIKKIEIPSTVKPIVGYHLPNNEKLKEIHFLDFDKSCFYNNVNNLWVLLRPYIKIINYNNNYKNIYELTIDELVFSFSDSKRYPSSIILSKENCRVESYSYSIDKMELIEKINDYVVEKVERYQGQKRKKRKNIL